MQPAGAACTLGKTAPVGGNAAGTVGVGPGKGNEGYATHVCLFGSGTDRWRSAGAPRQFRFRSSENRFGWQRGLGSLGPAYQHHHRQGMPQSGGIIPATARPPRIGLRGGQNRRSADERTEGPRFRGNDGRRRHRRGRRPEKRQGSDRPGAHRHGRAAGDGDHRPGVCQQTTAARQGRQGCRPDARLRSRHAHDLLGGCRTHADGAEKTMARHVGVHRATGGGDWRRSGA